MESVPEPRKFMSAARAAARNKPVLVVKAGRSPQGQAAASTHSAALATSDLVYDAAIRRAGMLRVGSLEDLFIAAETRTHFGGMTHGRGAETLERLTIMGNGVGPGVLATDACAAEGIELAPAGALGTNPIALVGNATIASTRSDSNSQRRISLGPDPAPPLNSGEPFRTIPARPPPS